MLTEIRGLHHVTAMAADAQDNNDFFTRTLGLRRVKKTVNFDAPEVYHLYYGDRLGSPGTAWTSFPFGARAGRGKRGLGEAGETAIGLLPTPGDLNTEGLEISDAALEELLTVDEELYRQAIPQMKEHFAKFGDSLPGEVTAQLDALEQRLG